jgi:hypothetical protein
LRIMEGISDGPLQYAPGVRFGYQSPGAV